MKLKQHKVAILAHGAGIIIYKLNVLLLDAILKIARKDEYANNIRPG